MHALFCGKSNMVKDQKVHKHRHMSLGAAGLYSAATALQCALGLPGLDLRAHGTTTTQQQPNRRRTEAGPRLYIKVPHPAYCARTAAARLSTTHRALARWYRCRHPLQSLKCSPRTRQDPRKSLKALWWPWFSRCSNTMQRSSLGRLAKEAEDMVAVLFWYCFCCSC